MHSRSGQSLVEVTFAAGVVSLVLVGLLSSIILSLRNARVALEQNQATQYAEESLEWIRQGRDQSGWGVFHSALVSRGGDVIYCLPALPANFDTLLSQAATECDEGEVIGTTVYTRQLQLRVLSPTQVEATAQVMRPGETGQVTTSLQTILSDWE